MNLDNGALLERIEDLAECIIDDASEVKIRYYADSIQALCRQLDDRKSFKEIQGRRD